MKRTILYLLLIIAGSSQGQYTKHITTIPPGWGSASGLKAAFGYHKGATSASGKLPMLFISLHGGGESGPEGDTTTANGIDKVALYGLPKLVRFNNIGTFIPYPNGRAEDARGVSVIFPQLKDTYGLWVNGYAYAMVEWAKANISNEFDTSMIFLTGLSMGGAGTLAAFTNPRLFPLFRGMFPICPAAYVYTNYAQVADSLPPVYAYMAVNDPVVPISNPDGMFSSTNQYRPIRPIEWYRFSGATPGFTGHSIWDAIYSVVPGTPAVLANGDTYNHIPIYRIAAGLPPIIYTRP